ncbi:hypothetical protein BGZ94_007906 [Podila epigama]|nr:hypothetical protein BGZ94_007906 [Podila epigama]
MPRIQRIVDQAVLKRLRPRKAVIDPSLRTPFQDAVLAIPELRGLITEYLQLMDRRTLASTCRTWRSYWLPYLYQRVVLTRYKRTRVYPNVRTYGHLMTHLCVSNTSWNNILFLVVHTPALLHLRMNFIRLTSEQTWEILAHVPHLRVLHCRFRTNYVSATYGHFGAASQLKNLETLIWDAPTIQVHISDLLDVLKECKRLSRLDLINTMLSEDPVKPTEMPGSVSKDAALDTASEGETKSELRAESKEEDIDSWQNNSLRSLQLAALNLPARAVLKVATATVHPIVRKFLSHIASLEKASFVSQNSFARADWEYFFERFPDIKHVEILPRTFRLYAHDTDAPQSIIKYCTNLQFLTISGSTNVTTSDMNGIINKNRGLKDLKTKNAMLDDHALFDLSAYALQSPMHETTLRVLDLERCRHITVAGMRKVLQICGGLQELNLRGTLVGTIELFNDGKPWPCAKRLQTLHIDIRHPNQSLHENPSELPFEVYSDKEQALIKSNLTSLCSLVRLDIAGLGTTLAMVGDLSFAPRLDKFAISAPLAIDEERANRFKIGREMMEEWGRARFSKEWVVHVSSYAHVHTIHATLSNVQRANIDVFVP